MSCRTSLGLVGLDHTRELIRTGSIATARDPAKQFLDLIGIPADHHPGKAHSVALAAVMDLAVGDDIVGIDLKIDGRGTGASCFVREHINSPGLELS